jgi:ATP adenylyltransferase
MLTHVNGRCRICNVVGGSHGRCAPIWDQVLFESKNFAVFPTVGSIIPGWLLVAPKQHRLCMGALDLIEFAELREVTNEACEALRERFGSVVVFEHGPTRPQSSVGCGVDHAHLHVVSTEIDMIEGVRALANGAFLWRQVNSIESTTRCWREGQPYLFVQRAGAEAWLTSDPNIGSQMFRRVIANACGLSTQFDWKLHSFESNVRLTVEAIEAHRTTALHNV